MVNQNAISDKKKFREKNLKFLFYMGNQLGSHFFPWQSRAGVYNAKFLLPCGWIYPRLTSRDQSLIVRVNRVNEQLWSFVLLLSDFFFPFQFLSHNFEKGGNQDRRSINEPEKKGEAKKKLTDCWSWWRNERRDPRDERSSSPLGNDKDLWPNGRDISINELSRMGRTRGFIWFKPRVFPYSTRMKRSTDPSNVAYNKM